MVDIKKGLFYTKTHEWVKVEGGEAYIGLTAFAASELGDIVYFEGPDTDDVAQGAECGVVESVKSASDIYSPVSGKVLEVNEAVVDSPELINEDPYGAWLIKVELDSKEELKKLLSAEDYEKELANA
ncbi:MAG TPA: glycine cleavage system protein GcvH [Acholeplasma sp.]|jgi:glycine cleavage system H protein|nr:glycine cleavage system protein GcvH [Acholeplasma sp.]